MGLMDLLGDHATAMLVGVGAWIVIGAGIGAARNLILTRARIARNQMRNAKAQRPTTAEAQANEDAAVAAFERYMAAEARFRALSSHQDLTARGRLH